MNSSKAFAIYLTDLIQLTKSSQSTSKMFNFDNYEWVVWLSSTSGSTMSVRLDCSPLEQRADWVVDSKIEFSLLSKAVKGRQTVASVNWRFNKNAPRHTVELRNSLDDFLKVSTIFEARFCIQTAKKCVGRMNGFIAFKKEHDDIPVNSVLQTFFHLHQFHELVAKVAFDTNNNFEKLQRIFYRLKNSNAFVNNEEFLYPIRDVRQFVSDFEAIIIEADALPMFESIIVSEIKQGAKTSYGKDGKSQATIALDVKKDSNGEWEVLSPWLPSVHSIDFSPICTVYQALYDSLQELRREDLSKGARVKKVFSQLPSVLNILLTPSVTPPEPAFYFEFYSHLNMEEFRKNPELPSEYELYAVLVNDFEVDTVYINIDCKGIWYKFVDEEISRCEESNAINDNRAMQFNSRKRFHNRHTYMLSYVKSADINIVFKKIE